MLGIILCGGQSSRMGTDKGMLRLQSITWAEAAANKIKALGLSVSVSVNNNQFTGYNTLFPPEQLIKDASLQLKGPLLGVLSAHLQYNTEDLLVLACDMLLMETGILEELIRHYQKGSAEAYVFTNNGQPEPLCGIYTARGLARIMERYHRQQLERHSMKFMLEHIDTFYQPLAEEQKKYFRNFNAHAELNGL